MKKVVSTAFLMLSLSCLLFGQQSSLTGAQILRSASGIYDQGRLHEIPTLLEEAFRQNKFITANEQVAAYRLLILTYIYLEEPAKADENMLSLLSADHFFVPNDSDPVEFKTLWRKFRTKPLFRIGAKFGVNQTYASAIKNYYVAGESAGAGTYSPNIAIHGLITFEKDLSGKFERFIVNPEIGYATQSFNYTNDNIYLQEDNSGDFIKASSDHKITHSRILLNALLQYRLYEKRNLFTYVALGPSVGYLLSSSFDATVTLNQGRQLTGNVDNSENYKPFNFAAVIAGGMKAKLGHIFLTADVRFQYGLANVVDEANRKELTDVNAQLNYIYHYKNNDFSLSQGMFSIGVIYPYFKPKKLIK